MSTPCSIDACSRSVSAARASAPVSTEAHAAAQNHRFPSTSARMSLPIDAFKLVAIAGIQHIAITARYEPHVSRGTFLSWIAPELTRARVALVGDHLSDPIPSRTWAGVVDEQTFARFAKSWGLQRGNNGDSASKLDDGTDVTLAIEGDGLTIEGKRALVADLIWNKRVIHILEDDISP